MKDEKKTDQGTPKERPSGGVQIGENKPTRPEMDKDDKSKSSTEAGRKNPRSGKPDD